MKQVRFQSSMTREEVRDTILGQICAEGEWERLFDNQERGLFQGSVGIGRFSLQRARYPFQRYQMKPLVVGDMAENEQGTEITLTFHLNQRDRIVLIAFGGVVAAVVIFLLVLGIIQSSAFWGAVICLILFAGLGGLLMYLEYMVKAKRLVRRLKTLLDAR